MVKKKNSDSEEAVLQYGLALPDRKKKPSSSKSDNSASKGNDKRRKYGVRRNTYMPLDESFPTDRNRRVKKTLSVYKQGTKNTDGAGKPGIGTGEIAVGQSVKGYVKTTQRPMTPRKTKKVKNK